MVKENRVLGSGISLKDFLQNEGIDPVKFEKLDDTDKMYILMKHDAQFKEAVQRFQKKRPKESLASIYNETFCEPFPSYHIDSLTLSLLDILFLCGLVIVAFAVMAYFSI